MRRIMDEDRKGEIWQKNLELVPEVQIGTHEWEKTEKVGATDFKHKDLKYSNNYYF